MTLDKNEEDTAVMRYKKIPKSSFYEFNDFIIKGTDKSLKHKNLIKNLVNVNEIEDLNDLESINIDIKEIGLKSIFYIENLLIELTNSGDDEIKQLIEQFQRKIIEDQKN